jgi:hypothetical protein
MLKNLSHVIYNAVFLCAHLLHVTWGYLTCLLATLTHIGSKYHRIINCTSRFLDSRAVFQFISLCNHGSSISAVKTSTFTNHYGSYLNTFLVFTLITMSNTVQWRMMPEVDLLTPYYLPIICFNFYFGAFVHCQYSYY